MAEHNKLAGLMSPLERLARVASNASETAHAAGTGKAGSIYVPNGDGTYTVIGELAGADGTGQAKGVSQFVGDTVPPSAPVGVSWESSYGDVTATWGGELAEGVPADFDHVEFRAGEELVGRLKRAGSVSAYLTAGSTYSCTAVAVDVQGNESEATEAVEVTVADNAGEAVTKVLEVERTAEDLTTKVTELRGGVEEQQTLIRQSGDGVEVARKVDGEYTSTKTLMDADGFHVFSSDGAELSSFGADTISLGKSSGSTVISMLGGKSRIWRDGFATVVEGDNEIMMRLTDNSDARFNVITGSSGTSAGIKADILDLNGRGFTMDNLSYLLLQLSQIHCVTHGSIVAVPGTSSSYTLLKSRDIQMTIGDGPWVAVVNNGDTVAAGQHVMGASFTGVNGDLVVYSRDGFPGSLMRFNYIVMSFY